MNTNQDAEDSFEDPTPPQSATPTATPKPTATLKPTETPKSTPAASVSESASKEPDSPDTEKVTCPLPVEAVKATSGLNQVEVSWSLSSDQKETGENQFNVLIEVTQAGERVRLVTEAAGLNSHVVTGLRNGVEYGFTVYGVNTFGRSQGAGPVLATPSTGAEGEVAGLIVEFAGSVPSVGEQSVPGEDKVASVDLQVSGDVTPDTKLVELSEPVSITQAQQIASELESDASVVWAEPDQFLFTASEDQGSNGSSGSNPGLAQTVSVPTDARYATDQWNLWDTYGINVGQGTESMSDAWAGPRGAGVTVAVIDTGITPHPDLDAQLVDGYDFVSNPEQLASTRQPNAPPVAFDGDYQDTNVYGPLGRDSNPADPGDWRDVTPTRASSWHGTKIAGLFAAQENADGITGIAPEAKIQPVRALSWRGGLLSDIAASITWASGGTISGAPVNATPSKVINMSFSVEATCPAALQDAIDGARDRGAILIAAAGNASDDAARYAPGNCDGVITVGASNRDGSRADYSNYGPAIDLSAPGGDTTSPVTTTSNTGTQTPNLAEYGTDFGTSIAAAHVAAAAAILASRDASLTPDQAHLQLTGNQYTQPFAGDTCDAANPDYSCGTGILTLAQIASVASGVQDFAMLFDRPSSSAAIASNPSMFSTLTGDFTFEAWAKPIDCSSGEHTVLSKELAFILTCRNGTWQYALGNGSAWYNLTGSDPWYNTGIAQMKGQWQHVALTRTGTGGAINFYLNGALANTRGAQTLELGNSTNFNFAVGARTTGSNAVFNGTLDEVRIYNINRANVSGANKISDDMHTYGPIDTSGLLAYYDFNEGPAGTTGTGTVFNRASGATAATNLRSVGGPKYTDIKQTTSNGANTVVTFPRSYLTAAGGWRVPNGVSTINYLVVGGGGGGGTDGGSGGGGGSLRNPSTPTAVAVGEMLGVEVGMGGRAGVYGSGVSPTAGQQSRVRVGGTNFTAPAGSGGVNAPSGGNGGAGGSGGGSTASGGAGGSAANGNNTSGTAGSNGPTSIITGSRVNYGGGGGGGVYPFDGTQRGPMAGGAGGGGAGGGGTNSSETAAAQNGTANTGGGGGGARADQDGTPARGPGGWGGSGVVIVSYSTRNTTCAPFESSYVDNGTLYRVLQWSDPSQGACQWTPPTGVTSIDYLVTGGGGGGGGGGYNDGRVDFGAAGGDGGGGGGGGGGLVRSGTATVSSSSAITATVGSGGAGGTPGIASGAWAGRCGSDGGATTLSGLQSPSSVSAAGGGGGGGGSLKTIAGCTALQYIDGIGGPGGSSDGRTGFASDTGRTGGQGASSSANGTSKSTLLVQGIQNSITGTATRYGSGGGGGPESAGNSTTGSMGADFGAGGGGGEGRTNGATGNPGTVIIRYAVVASGVCIPTESTYTSGGTPYTVVEFQGAGTCNWTVPSGVGNVDVLAVGGGGGGGAHVGGGGGGGGVREMTDQTVTGGASISVQVGAGGAGASSPASGERVPAGSGAASSFGSISAAGGGGGATWNLEPGAGGSGGGGAKAPGGNGNTPATTPAQGFNGGEGRPESDSNFATGGGGGAGGAGQSFVGGNISGSGGVGKNSDLSGATVTYGGGGGGGVHGTGSATPIPGLGGSGGGGSGNGYQSVSCTATLGSGSCVGGLGTDGLGGGGGGSGGPYVANVAGSTVVSVGGDGGDGVVIIRYQNTPGAATSITGLASAPGKVTVSWTAPAHAGSTAITGYTVTSTPGSFTCTTATTSCDVTGLTPGTSYTFTVVATNASGNSVASNASAAVVPFGALAKFAVTDTSGNAMGTQTAGTPFAIKVTAQDSGNRTVLNFTGTVDLTSTSLFGAGGGTTAAFTAGVMASHSVTLTRAGDGQTLTATRTSGGSETGASAGFTVGAGSATKLQVLLPGETAAPGTASGKTGTPTAVTAGTSVSATVNAVDANWNVVTTSNPTVAISSTDGAAALPGNASLSSGTKAFAVTLKTAGSRTITATDQAGSGTLTTGTSAPVTVNPGAASTATSTITASPLTLIANGSSTSTITVTVKDAYSNNLTSTGGTVVVSSTLGSVGSTTNNNDGTYTATLTAGTAAGVASISATLNTNALTNTASVTFTSGTATKLVVTGSGSQTAGASQTITITAQDANGNTATGYTGAKAVTFSGANSSANPVTAPTVAGTTFGSSTSLTFTNGVATAAMVLFKSESAVIAVTDGSLSSSGSGNLAVAVSAATANKLVIGTQPVAGASGSTLAAQPVVRVLDQYGNLSSSTATVNVSASGGTLGGAEASSGKAAVVGVATFTNLTFAGSTSSSYTLTFTSTGLTSITSTSVTPSDPGPATKLAFTVQPSNVVAGVVISPAVQVTVQDAFDNTVQSATSITLAIGTNPGSGSLSGTTGKRAASGVATFSDLSINKSGVGYTLTASASGLTGATSAAIDVSAASASTIAVNAGNNQSATVGTAVTTLPSVIVTDAFGNAIAGTAVTFAVTSGGGSLASSGSVTTNSSGIATSPAWTLGTTAGSNTLTATSGSLSGSPITFTATGTAGAAMTIAVNAGNGQSAVAGTAVSTSPSVLVTDSAGNAVQGVSVVFAVASGGGSLATSGSVTTNSSGIATSPAWTLGMTAGSNTLTATSGSLSGSPVTFTATGTAGAAAGLVISGSNSQIAGALQNLTVTAQDANGNTATGYTGDQLLTFTGANASPTGLSPTVTDKNSTAVDFGSPASITFTAGVATVPVTLYKAEFATLVATDGNGKTSNPSGNLAITVSAGAAASLAVTTAAGDSTYGSNFAPQPVIAVRDSSGNTVTSWSTAITATIKSAGGATLETGTATPTSGVATFNGLGSTADAGTLTVEYTSGALTLATETVVVTPAVLTVQASSPSVTFGDPVPTVTASYSGFLNGDTVAVVTTPATCATAYTPTSNAGTTPATTCSGAVATNYTFTYLAGSVTIAKATPTLGAFANVNKTYGDAAFTVVAPTAVGVVPGTLAGSFTYTSGTTGVATVSGSTVTLAGAGSSVITALFTPTDSTNYTTANTTMTLAVAKAPLTVTASSATVTFGDAAPTITPSFSGFVNGQGSADLATQPVCSTLYTSSSPVGTYASSCSGAASENYSFAYVDGSVTVNAKTVSLSWSDLSKTFGDPAFALTAPTATGVGGASVAGTTTYVSSDTQVASVSAGVVTIVGAGTATLTATFVPTSSNYAGASVNSVLTVDKATQATLVMSSPNSAIYGETITLAATGGSGTGTLSFSVTSPIGVGKCSLSGTTLTLGDAGSLCKVRATKADSANYVIAQSSEQTISIAQAGQVIAFTSNVPGSPVSGGTYSPAASVTSTVTGTATGVSPTFSVSGTCTVSTGVVTFNAAGNCVVTAAAAGNTNFTSATNVIQTIVVGSINQNITFTQPANVSFGSSSVSMVASASSSLPVSFSLGSGTTNAACSVSSGGVVTILAVGTCSVNADQSGNSQYAAASQVTRSFVVNPALASAPALSSASASSQAITVGFTAPGFTGGVSVSGYEVVASPVGGGVSVTSRACVSSPCTITGLVNGTAYTVTVAAINSAGTGPASSASSALTPATAAFAVGNLAAAPGDTVVNLSWTALTNAQLGGGSFTRYEVNYRAAGPGAWTSFNNNVTGQSTSSLTVTGLTNSVSYDFQVVAITTANATEIPGNTAEVVQYPSTVPSAPRSLATLASTATEVQFSWQVPLSDGGAALTSPNYTVTVTSNTPGATSPVACSFANVADRFCTVTGLSNAAEYDFAVNANNRMGAGAIASVSYSVPSSDATLSALVVNGAGAPISLSPSFASGTTAYSASVVNDVSSVTLTPTASDPGATITVNAIAVASGSDSRPIALAVGVNTITVVVTATDPRFSETTTVTITRAAPPVNPSGGGASITPGDLEPQMPPADVMSGSILSAVTDNGVMQSTRMIRTETGNGWQGIGSGFDFTVVTEKQDGAPEPLADNGELQVPQGGRIVVVAEGYLAATQVNVFLVPNRDAPTTARAGVITPASESLYLGSTRVNSGGSINHTFLVPLGTSLGQYVLQINGVSDTVEVRSINMATSVIAGPSPRTYSPGFVQRAAFFNGLSDSISKSGTRKLRQMVRALPKNATAVQVQVVGVSVSLDSLTANLDLAQTRAKKLANYFKKQGVSGTFTVTVSTTFTIDGAERAVTNLKNTSGGVTPVFGADGKPLTTATILFQSPDVT